MKYLIILLLFLVETNVVAKTYNSENKIVLQSKHLHKCYIQYSDSILIKRAKKVNTLKLNIDEPQRVLVKNSKTKNYFFLYIEKGKNTIYIDLDKYIVSSRTSTIANENAEVLRIKKHYDTIADQYYIIIASLKDTLGIYTNKADSINKLYHIDFFNWCLQHPKSFISLGFTNFLSYSYNSVGFTKEDVNKLFDSLDESLYNYPTYITCKEYIAEYINNPNFKMEELPKPLWNPK